MVHFDGRTFARHRGPDGAMLSVASVGPGEAWAAGVGGGLLHVTGGVPSAMHLEREGKPVGIVLRDVAATGRTDVWFAGDEATLLRWDGKTLAPVDTKVAEKRAAFAAVIALGTRPGWVVGPGGIFRIVK